MVFSCLCQEKLSKYLPFWSWQERGYVEYRDAAQDSGSRLC